MRISVYGLGNVGGALARYLKQRDHLFGVKTRNLNKEKTYCAELQCNERSEEEILNESDILFLAVRDDSIQEVVQKFVPLLRKKRAILHLSGGQPEELLQPFKEKGWEIGSFHPIQSFPSPNPEYFHNIYASFTGPKKILNKLKSIFSEDVVFLHLTDEEKLVVHISAVFVSNFVVYLCRKAIDLLPEKKIDILLPLIQTTLENIKQRGVDIALTGPAKRKDIETINRHKEALKSYPEILSIYNFLTQRILNG